jgi:hypothetical protein
LLIKKRVRQKGGVGRFAVVLEELDGGTDAERTFDPHESADFESPPFRILITVIDERFFLEELVVLGFRERERRRPSGPIDIQSESMTSWLRLGYRFSWWGSVNRGWSLLPLGWPGWRCRWLDSGWRRSGRRLQLLRLGRFHDRRFLGRLP